jgi:hypothetical protein
MEKVKTTGSLLGKKRMWKYYVLTYEKLDDAGSGMEPSQRKSLHLLAV